MEKELLQSLEGRHPAFEMPFHELLTGLTLEVEAGNVSMRESDDGLQIYCYTMQCTVEKSWNVFSLISRGLILDIENEVVVATPFPKFFNYGEALYVPDEPFVTTEKMDGSLGILFHHNGKWRVATKGSFQSDQAVWAMEYVKNKVDTSWLHPKSTYLVEIIYPENRIVIPYLEDGLFLLAIYMDGYEFDRGFKKPYEAGYKAGLKEVNICSFENVDEIIEYSKTLNKFEEGFVVRFENGYRLKIKGDSYCRIHRLISNCTPLFIWNCLRACDNLDLIRAELPEEFHTDFDNIRQLLKAKFYKSLSQIEDGFEKCKCLSDKELGLLLHNAEASQRFSDVQKQFIFACRKNDFLKKVWTKGKERDRLFKSLRPKANVLEGFIPSNVMNRFTEESI